MEKAVFKLDRYHFTRASLDFNIPNDAELNISFNPSGVFHSKEARYDLVFDVTVGCNETNTEVIKVSCEASFSFGNKISIAEIPEYFYPIVSPLSFHTSELLLVPFHCRLTFSLSYCLPSI